MIDQNFKIIQVPTIRIDHIPCKNVPLRDRCSYTKIVTFLKNDSTIFTGLVMTVSENKYKDLSILLKELSSKLTLNTGAVVNRIYNEDGIEIKKINEFLGGKKYICSTRPMMVIGNKNHQLDRQNSKNHLSRPLINYGICQKIKASDSSLAINPSSSLEWKPKILTIMSPKGPPYKKITYLFNVKFTIFIFIL
ncbi:hypothetical protein HZS_3192 [Henneguya salminicola]|nr:hypothetical protein HZS_3192 [Henneguya salminicola]